MQAYTYTLHIHVYTHTPTYIRAYTQDATRDISHTRVTREDKRQDEKNTTDHTNTNAKPTRQRLRYARAYAYRTPMYARIMHAREGVGYPGREGQFVGESVYIYFQANGSISKQTEVFSNGSISKNFFLQNRA